MISAPTRPKTATEVAWRTARRGAHQALRLGWWALSPQRWPSPELWSAVRHPAVPHRVHEARISVARSDPHADPSLEAGKRRNLALAAPAFDGLLLTPTQPLSFWRALGRVTRARGYADGMELRGGCVVPSVGGGLCLLSNALFELAARAGLDVLERHGHSIEAVPPAPGVLALDATVAWPHVDLVIAPARGAARLGVKLDGDALVVTLDADAPLDGRVELAIEDDRVEHDRRRGRIVRRRLAADGAVVAVEHLGDNDRRVLHSGELGRTCITCGETRCADRPPGLVALGRR